MGIQSQLLANCVSIVTIHVQRLDMKRNRCFSDLSLVTFFAKGQRKGQAPCLYLTQILAVLPRPFAGFGMILNGLLKGISPTKDFLLARGKLLGLIC